MSTATSDQAAGTTITCPICDASYIPSLPISPVHLEMAYMSMCHFCFRCRRAACPQCWDQVHGICGACVQDAELPFRTEVAPLNGLLYPHLQQPQSHPDTSALVHPFTCVQTGRFQTPTPETAPQHDASAPSLQESPSREKLSLQETRPQIELPAVKRQAKTQAPEKARAVEHSKDKRTRKPRSKIVERVLNVLLLVVLLIIVGMIVAAEFSDVANTLFIRLLQIDIRHEIAYLFYLIQQLHW